MHTTIETTIYTVSQIFTMPVLLAVIILFFYAFYVVGMFLWQAHQRRRNDPAGFDLIASWRNDRRMTVIELETLAFKRLEGPRIVTRVTPMLGLVATMIPMGPALKSLADGELASVSANLTVAFSAVILSLIAASLTYWVVNVRRRWYAEELVEIQRGRAGSFGAHADQSLPEAVLALAEEPAQ